MKDLIVKKSKDSQNYEENVNEIKQRILDMLVKLLNRRENTPISPQLPAPSPWSAKRTFHKTKDDRKRPGWELAYGKRSANWDNQN